MVRASKATLVAAFDFADAHHGTAFTPVLIQVSLAVEEVAGVELVAVTGRRCAIGDEFGKALPLACPQGTRLRATASIPATAGSVVAVCIAVRDNDALAFTVVSGKAIQAIAGIAVDAVDAGAAV